MRSYCRHPVVFVIEVLERQNMNINLGFVLWPDLRQRCGYRTLNTSWPIRFENSTGLWYKLIVKLLPAFVFVLLIIFI